MTTQAQALVPEVQEEVRTFTLVSGQELFKAEAQKALAAAKSLSVTDNASLLAADDLRANWAARGSALLALLNPGCQAADKLHKDLVKDRDSCVGPYSDAARLTKQKMIAYEEERRQIQRREQARLDAEAKRKAEEEALDLAAELEKAGLKQEAEEVISEPVQAAPVVAPKTTPKIEGFSYRSNWKWRVTNAALIPREYLTTDDVKISGIVRAAKKLTNIPGIEVYEEKV